MTAAIYARVSTTDQTCENPLLELRRYADERGWTVAREYVDEGVSGTKPVWRCPHSHGSRDRPTAGPERFGGIGV